MSSRFLAFDLGAESGRAMLARLRSGILDVTEAGRFSNQPLQLDGTLRWNVQELWSHMTACLDRLRAERLDGIGVDTWGVDYALLDDAGELVEAPYHYRDSRTDGVMARVFERIPREELYSITGIQFLPFNTLYQLYAAHQANPALLASARSLVTIPDLLNYWLTGKLACEYTNATTTQMLDARTHQWSRPLLNRIDLPTRLLLPIVQPGSILGPHRAHAGTPVIAPACHDTGSAVAAVSLTPRSAYLSSGTWSLLGAELPAPVVTPRALELNFTNEGGVCGTVRLLKNIAGLWLLQACRRDWAAAGRDFSYPDLLAAAESATPFRSLFDPDHPSLLNPPNMPAAIAEVCRASQQPTPRDAPALVRAILESLAFKYRNVLHSLEELTGIRFEEIRVMGGGSKNRLLNRFTADATGRPVIAGPAEATALGNIAMQMLATGAVSSLAEARQIIDRSFPVERFEPSSTEAWDAHDPGFGDHRKSIHD